MTGALLWEQVLLGGQTQALGTLSTVDLAVAGHTSPWVEAEHP